jgi:hypothetical protein
MREKEAIGAHNLKKFVPYPIRHTALSEISLGHGRDTTRAVTGHTTGKIVKNGLFLLTSSPLDHNGITTLNFDMIRKFSNLFLKIFPKGNIPLDRQRCSV